MRASIIVRSKDEADRLRLTLASLAAQTAEVVVVNDGSSDHTAAVMAAAADLAPLTQVHHDKARGRSAAANAGADCATGDILIFLDGDTLAAPDFVEQHLAIHRASPNLVARGETLHLRCTRFFLNPDQALPFPAEIDRVGRMSATELERARVTYADVVGNFQAIHQRAQPGIYPGAGPRRLYELEMNALSDHPDCTVLWAAASGSNQSVNARIFRQIGGFDPELTINEHRELALRLCKAGSRMVPAPAARSYHLTHRSGWRDPLADRQWESRFYAIHPIAAVALLQVFWASLSDPISFPHAARITSLTHLASAAEACVGLMSAEQVRGVHFANAGSAATALQ